LLAYDEELRRVLDPVWEEEYKGRGPSEGERKAAV